MCGFCGFTGNSYNDDNNSVLNKMIERIEHRGPDSAGVYVDDHVSLGFRRLGFNDLEAGMQPMFNEDKSIAIVFNGEIYNFEALREKLLEAGHTFATSADTEVLIHLYEDHGVKMFDYIRGMFAFVIYDIKHKKIFAARDFFGIKPFYYAMVDNNLLFSSEIKSFLEYPKFEKEINLSALDAYLTCQYSALEETFFVGVKKLEPGHFLTYQNGELTIERYHELHFEEESYCLEDNIEKIDAVINDSVTLHKTSDVEIGSFLSSGVDSSLLASKLGSGGKTFTVGFDFDEYSEIDYAKALSDEFGLTHFSKIITEEEYWGVLPKIQYHMDEPLADPSAVALYFVSELASKHVKGVFSGEGADEFFGGYNIYKEPLDLALYAKIPKFIRKLLAAIVKKLPNFKGKNFIIRGSLSVEERFIGNAKMFSKEEKRKILKSDIPVTDFGETVAKPLYDQIKHYDDITKMQYIDLHLWLRGDILLKADKMSMAHSLEVRVPYLDKEVFEVAKTLPTHHRVNKEDTKYAFRKVANKTLKDSVANKKKLGFPVPIRIWLKMDKYAERIKEAFEGEVAQKYFNTEEIVKLLADHKEGRADNSRKIWTIYMFLLWHREYF